MDHLLSYSTRKKEDGEILIADQKQQLIALATQDATHCHKPIHELITELGFHICTNTVIRSFAVDGIHRRAPTTKPFLTNKQKEERLFFAPKYINFDVTGALFQDESYFDSSNLCAMHAKQVLRREGEEFIPRNIKHKFLEGIAGMFWEGIMYEYYRTGVTVY